MIEFYARRVRNKDALIWELEQGLLHHCRMGQTNDENWMGMLKKIAGLERKNEELRRGRKE